ncbi:MAG: 30S ribosomal protein S6 [Acidobacteriota bacterium]
MRVYEVLFIVSPKTEEEDIQSLITQFSDTVTHQGASVTNVNRLGLRRLAYPIQKFNEGHYVILTVEGSGKEIAEIERRMRVVDAVIRYLTIRIDEDLKRAAKFKARRSSRNSNHAPKPRRDSRGNNYAQASREEGDE